ncbi:alcohol dehydrogenase [Corallococcus exercitus]|uniref:Alcohol dehydrogenase catalytic domain-containing protein n=1 Tax=Corallococcus exercitus TaxID=2316736 RepID=A0A3A8HNE8_9BACT|nr:alcohol dehydrogenase [Corallococcus exercitus]NOK38869.1 alcohol dehydrogenase catalytic domain-containing protein [Corallococcus exercitus]RKG72912.1 alcohol dehydrogenase [Corallococcus exercitus]
MARKMKAVQVPKAKGPLEVVEREVPEPGPGQVRLAVEACGVCHSDAITKEGWMPIQYPRVPGHEVVGRIDRVGPGVTAWKEGQHVGVGWHGGHCGQCVPCRSGDFVTCEKQQICGISYDGGYAEYLVAPQEALARVPEGMSSEDAAPLLCAGVTTYNSLRNMGARPGDLVAVQGIGGLGHLAIQYAQKFGYRTVAISRGADKRSLALELGAHEYIDTEKGSAAEALQKMGGARVIMMTASSSSLAGELLGGLGRNGTLLLLGAGAEPIPVSSLSMISKRTRIQGWPSGVPQDSQETMAFSALAGVRSRNEVFPLERATEAFERMMSNKARFRVVLKMR